MEVGQPPSWASQVTPFTPRVKPCVIQRFLTVDSMYRTIKCDHSLKSCSTVLYYDSQSETLGDKKFSNFYCGSVCFLVLPSL